MNQRYHTKQKWHMYLPLVPRRPITGVQQVKTSRAVGNCHPGRRSEMKRHVQTIWNKLKIGCVRQRKLVNTFRPRPILNIQQVRHLTLAWSHWYSKTLSTVIFGLQQLVSGPVLYWMKVTMNWQQFFCISLSLHFNGHFPGELRLAGFIWAKDDGKWWWQVEL